MSIESEVTVIDSRSIQRNLGVDESLNPKTDAERTVGPVAYMAMWTGDGVNTGNMTLGASLVVAGVATLNIVQTFAAAVIAIGLITLIFTLNDKIGYKTGVPYVVQLRMSFGMAGSVISALCRGVPAIVWYGVQSWIGATALNQIAKIVTGGAFNSIVICFIVLQVVQIVLSLYGFRSIKWVESLISGVLLLAILYVFVVLLKDHSAVIGQKWVHARGSWGLPFFSLILVFLGNYAAIFLSAGDYSRELKVGYGSVRRGALYFSPIFVAYGFVLCIGAILAAVTGVSNPVNAFAIAVNNPYITFIVSAFIVGGAVATNMVANIVPPTYVLTLLTKIKYKAAVTITGLLGMVAFPWVLVQNSSAKGLDIFIEVYSAFLGPIVAILIVEFYVLRRQKFSVEDLYKADGPFSGYNKAAVIAMLVGAAAAFVKVSLAWIVGAVVAAIVYLLLSKFAFADSKFKIGTIFERKSSQES